MTPVAFRTRRSVRRSRSARSARASAAKASAPPVVRRALELDLHGARSLHDDRPAIHVRPAVELAECDKRRPAREVTGEEDVELAIVERCLWSDMHPRPEVRSIRGDDRKERSALEFSVDEHAHRARAIRGDPDERSHEVAQRLSNDARDRGHTLGDVAIDPDPCRVHEDASIQIPDVDGAPTRFADEARHVAGPLGISERAGKVVPRADGIESEGCGATDDAIRDLVRRPVATGGNDHPVSVRGGLAREPRGLVRRGRAHDVETDTVLAEVGGDPTRHALARAVPRDRVHDGEGTLVAQRGRGRHAPEGASALRMASCSSLESACRERPPCTCLAKMRVSVRL